MMFSPRCSRVPAAAAIALPCVVRGRVEKEKAMFRLKTAVFYTSKGLGVKVQVVLFGLGFS